MGFMARPRPADELDELRNLLKRLESGELTLMRTGVDVTQHEIGFLKRQIAYLERILAHAKSRGRNAPRPPR